MRSNNLKRATFLLAIILSLVACRQAETVPLATLAPAVQATAAPVVVTRLPTATTQAAATESSFAVDPTPPVVPSLPSIPESTRCGTLLDPLPGVATSPIQLKTSDTTRASLREIAPPAAWPALERLLNAPDTVGLVAFQAGRQSEGVYLNADLAMPLASIAKLITLVAYTEAVAAGELNPQEQIPLAELDRYYLPNFDLGAHRRALNELRQNDRLISPDSEPAVLLQDVAWMMIRHSSNAAADYLHLRLGQQRIEETAISLGLNDAPASHSAPCTFLGQFLMMGNHSRPEASDRAALTAIADGSAAAYGDGVAQLADTYINDPAFRAAEQEWRSATRRPNMDAQRYFASRIAPQGTAGAYAALMSRLAQNGLSNADSSYQARLILEWPNQFDVNQDVFSNIGYKNGALAGVLNSAYYAYRWGDSAPVIVVLFFRDIPQQTYRSWRFDLPHDELARWLLADPAAIPALAAALRESAP